MRFLNRCRNFFNNQPAYPKKITAIESIIYYEQPTKSNLEIMIDDSLMMASQLNVVWDRSDLENKKMMSRTLFPEGVLYDPENRRYLTKNVNSYFGLINTLSTSYKENKKGINHYGADLSPFNRTGLPMLRIVILAVRLTQSLTTKRFANSLPFFILVSLHKQACVSCLKRKKPLNLR